MDAAAVPAASTAKQSSDAKKRRSTKPASREPKSGDSSSDVDAKIDARIDVMHETCAQLLLQLSSNKKQLDKAIASNGGDSSAQHEAVAASSQATGSSVASSRPHPSGTFAPCDPGALQALMSAGSSYSSGEADNGSAAVDSVAAAVLSAHSVPRQHLNSSSAVSSGSSSAGSSTMDPSGSQAADESLPSSEADGAVRRRRVRSIQKQRLKRLEYLKSLNLRNAQLRAEISKTAQQLESFKGLLHDVFASRGALS